MFLREHTSLLRSLLFFFPSSQFPELALNPLIACPRKGCTLHHGVFSPRVLCQPCLKWKFKQNRWFYAFDWFKWFSLSLYSNYVAYHFSTVTLQALLLVCCFFFRGFKVTFRLLLVPDTPIVQWHTFAYLQHTLRPKQGCLMYRYI